MRTNRHVPFFFCALISVLSSSGLFFSAASLSFSAPAQSVPVGLNGVGTGISATLPDPKRPGKLLYELRAQSASGQSDASGFHGDLNSVWARLYQNGVSSAVLTAPHAHGGSAGKAVTITGTGGVVVKSLTEKGTTMTAETVVWYAGSNQIIATGHVVYHGGKTGLLLTGPRMTFDTRLKTFQMGRGHGTMPL